MNTRLLLASLTLCLALLAGCEKKQPTNQNGSNPSGAQSTPFTVKIDWVPTPEYYGFFYAQHKGLYKAAGLDVKILNGTGAPAVAKELAVGSLYAGTTTSDNVLREMHGGAAFTRVTPLLRFNPCVIISRPEKPIKTLADLAGKTLGTNQQSSTYQQLTYLIAQKRLDADAFKEFPIGWGGAAQLKAGQVDGFLQYTTNAAVDVALDGTDPVELRMSDYGIDTMGLVLVISGGDILLKNNVSQTTVDAFIAATKQGYEKGAQDIPGVVEALKKAEPTLEAKKIEAAVAKIARLNAAAPTTLNELDKWLVGSDIAEETRKRMVGIIK